jgi:septal ring factor EnvC (AmiA/AmiB activator)
MLAYADRVRLMSPAELGLEAARLGEVPTPADQLRLSLVLSQLRQLPDLLRAQELLARVLGNATAEAQALHPLARLLAARYGEQRRLEELLEKQTQQTRDVQRRLDQTHERLEALKAIERSLTNRPPTAAVPEPARRARTPAP